MIRRDPPQAAPQGAASQGSAVPPHPSRAQAAAAAPSRAEDALAPAHAPDAPRGAPATPGAPAPPSPGRGAEAGPSAAAPLPPLVARADAAPLSALYSEPLAPLMAARRAGRLAYLASEPERRLPDLHVGAEQSIQAYEDGTHSLVRRVARSSAAVHAYYDAAAEQLGDLGNMAWHLISAGYPRSPEVFARSREGRAIVRALRDERNIVAADLRHIETLTGTLAPQAVALHAGASSGITHERDRVLYRFALAELIPQGTLAAADYLQLLQDAAFTLAQAMPQQLPEPPGHPPEVSVAGLEAAREKLVLERRARAAGLQVPPRTATAAYQDAFDDTCDRLEALMARPGMPRDAHDLLQALAAGNLTIAGIFLAPGPLTGAGAHVTREAEALYASSVLSTLATQLARLRADDIEPLGRAIAQMQAALERPGPDTLDALGAGVKLLHAQAQRPIVSLRAAARDAEAERTGAASAR